MEPQMAGGPWAMWDNAVDEFLLDQDRRRLWDWEAANHLEDQAFFNPLGLQRGAFDLPWFSPRRGHAHPIFQPVHGPGYPDLSKCYHDWITIHEKLRKFLVGHITSSPIP